MCGGICILQRNQQIQLGGMWRSCFRQAEISDFGEKWTIVLHIWHTGQAQLCISVS